MNDATPNPGTDDLIADWMIALLEDDRPARADTMKALQPGLTWIYEASLIRSN